MAVSPRTTTIAIRGASYPPDASSLIVREGKLPPYTRTREEPKNLGSIAPAPDLTHADDVTPLTQSGVPARNGTGDALGREHTERPCGPSSLPGTLSATAHGHVPVPAATEARPRADGGTGLPRRRSRRRAKRKAAQRWANHVNADESVEPDWIYLSASEDDVDGAADWITLKALATLEGPAELLFKT